jgi:hypothetical protein
VPIVKARRMIPIAIRCTALLPAQATGSHTKIGMSRVVRLR